MNNQSGYNKRSLKERENMAITVYKYLLDNNRIAYEGAAHTRLDELIKRKAMRKQG